MQGFFRGWKRKVGIVTLGVACLFTAGWIRSWGTADRFGVAQTSSRRLFESVKGELHLLTQISAETGVLLSAEALQWQSEPSSDSDSLAMLRMVSAIDVSQKLTASISNGEVATVEQEDKTDNDLTRMGFWYCSTNCASPPMQMSCVSLPYWLIVFPLSVVSAWLLLSKPRKAAAVRSDEVT